MLNFNSFISLLSLPWRKIIIIIAFQMHRLVGRFPFFSFCININAEIIRNLCWQGRISTKSYELSRLYVICYNECYMLCNPYYNSFFIICYLNEATLSSEWGHLLVFCFYYIFILCSVMWGSGGYYSSCCIHITILFSQPGIWQELSQHYA